jgi:peptide/nickel transport system substrate-binding protein
MFHTWHAGADCLSPAGYNALRTNGDKAWFGWPESPKVEAAIDEWYAAPDAAAEKKAVDAINTAGFEHVIYAPTGFFLSYQAWRKNVSGIGSGPLPFFWGVSKA